nr:hypothetical protein [Phytohabitans suffuscus]
MNLDERQLAKLAIEPYRDQEFREPAGVPWQALFNPTQLGFSRKNNYRTATSAGSSAPQTSYGGGEPDQVQLDLFFDGTGVVESTQTVGSGSTRCSRSPSSSPRRTSRSTCTRTGGASTSGACLPRPTCSTRSSTGAASRCGPP